MGTTEKIQLTTQWDGPRLIRNSFETKFISLTYLWRPLKATNTGN